MDMYTLAPGYFLSKSPKVCIISILVLLYFV